MGRWGDGIYESDAVLDYFVQISNLIEREIAFWMSPEQIWYSAKWLRKIFTVIEIILLFDQHKIGTTSYLYPWEQASPVPRWESEFFKVWDGGWEEENNRLPYCNSEYRRQHRSSVKKLFDRITELVAYWSDNDENIPDELPPFIPDSELPFFSVIFVERKSGDVVKVGDDFMYVIVEFLIYKNVYTLSDENRKDVIGLFQIEAVWMAVDILGILGEIYKFAPVSSPMVKMWQRKMYDIWDARLTEDDMIASKSGNLLANVTYIFERLVSATTKYALN